jgi:hypothetical protein
MGKVFERKSPPPWVWGLFGVLSLLGGCWTNREECGEEAIPWMEDPRVADAVPLANGWHAGCAEVHLDWDSLVPKRPLYREEVHFLFLGPIKRPIGCRERFFIPPPKLHRLVGFWLDLVVQDPPSWLTEGVRVPVAYLWEESARGVTWGEGGSFSVPVWLEWLPVVERGGRKVLQGLWVMPFWGWHRFRFSGGERMWELWGDLPSSGQCWVTREVEIPGTLLEPSPGTEGPEVQGMASSLTSVASLLKKYGEPVAVLAYMWGEGGFYRLGEGRMRLPDGKYRGVWRLEWVERGESKGLNLGEAYLFVVIEVLEVAGGKVIRSEDRVVEVGDVWLPKLKYSAGSYSNIDRGIFYVFFYGDPELEDFKDPRKWCLKPSWWSGDCFFAPFPPTTVSVEEASGVP